MEATTGKMCGVGRCGGDGQGLTPVFGSADAGEDRIKTFTPRLARLHAGPPRQELDELMGGKKQ